MLQYPSIDDSDASSQIQVKIKDGVMYVIYTFALGYTASSVDP